MDNKRFILFLAISIFILIGYQYLFPTPQPVKQQPATQEEKTGGEATTAPPVQTTPSILTSGLQQSELLENYLKEQENKTAQPIIVRTDLYTLTLNNKGAVISSWLLNDYRDKAGKDSNLVELVSKGSKVKNFYPLSLLFEDKNLTQRTNNSFYEASSYNLSLSKNKPEGELELFYTDPNGLKVTKTIHFYNDNYYVAVNIKHQNLGSVPASGRYYLTWGYDIGREKENSKYHYIGPSTYIDDKFVENKPKDIENKLEQRGNISWIALQDGYFASILIPQTVTSETIIRKEDNKLLSIGLASEGNQIPAGAEVTNRFGLYAGPKKMEHLQALKMNLDKIIDYGWFDVLAKPLMRFLKFTNGYTGNFGWDIIILTVLIKILFYPLTTASFKSMRNMQKVQPKLNQLRKKYKDDPNTLNREIMDLYKKHKVNPLGGCMPMFLQIPVFFALYKALLISIELRHAPFGLWLTDLSAKDPYYVTPILMGISMFVQQKMTPSSADPKQAKFMMLMPIIFTAMFLNFPVGLVIYWLLNNVLGVGQQYLINKQEAAKEAVV